MRRYKLKNLLKILMNMMKKNYLKYLTILSFNNLKNLFQD